jgi:uncharacterized protein (DUF302 family)
MRSEATMQLDYTVHTDKGFDQAVEAVVQATKDAGFRVLFTHDVAATLAEKGFDRERVSIVEICNAKFASQVLAADVRIGLMLPCPIMVYAEKGEVFITTMRATLIADFFPDAEISAVAAEVETVLLGVVDASAG